MSNKMMKAVKNMAIGAAVGAAAITAGSMYVSENRQAQKAINNAKHTGKKIAKAGESYMRNIVD